MKQDVCVCVCVLRVLSYVRACVRTHPRACTLTWRCTYRSNFLIPRKAPISSIPHRVRTLPWRSCVKNHLYISWFGQNRNPRRWSEGTLGPLTPILTWFGERKEWKLTPAPGTELLQASESYLTGFGVFATKNSWSRVFSLSTRRVTCLYSLILRVYFQLLVECLLALFCFFPGIFEIFQGIWFKCDLN